MGYLKLQQEVPAEIREYKHFEINTYILGSEVSNPADCRQKEVTASGICGQKINCTIIHTLPLIL
jgi:hypothetical protein